MAATSYVFTYLSFDTKLEHRDDTHCVTWVAEKPHKVQLLLHPAMHH